MNNTSDTPEWTRYPQSGTERPWGVVKDVPPADSRGIYRQPRQAAAVLIGATVIFGFQTGAAGLTGSPLHVSLRNNVAPYVSQPHLLPCRLPTIQDLAASAIDEKLRALDSTLPIPMKSAHGDETCLSWRGEDIWVTADIDDHGSVELFARNDQLHRVDSATWKIGSKLPEEIVWALGVESV